MLSVIYNHYMEYRNTKGVIKLLRFVTGPFIWFPLPAMMILDIAVELYQAVCFPIYGIEKVKRAKYILVRDRNKLQYLTGFEKVGCMYCGYANGLLLYVKEIAGLTEKYWCGIMHEKTKGAVARPWQKKYNFAKFGDKEDFVEKYGPIK